MTELTKTGQAIVDRYGWEDDYEELATDVAKAEAEAVERWLASPDAERRLAAVFCEYVGHRDPSPMPCAMTTNKARAILAALRENPASRYQPEVPMTDDCPREGCPVAGRHGHTEVNPHLRDNPDPMLRTVAAQDRVLAQANAALRENRND